MNKDTCPCALQPAKALLATCYMRCDEHYRVPRLLQGCQDQQCRYLLATCLAKLPGKLQEARAVLLPGNDRSRVRALELWAVWPVFVAGTSLSII